MKKINDNYKGFYEDEESIKMMDAINKSANDHRKKVVAKRTTKKKKESIMDKLEIGFVLVSLIFIVMVVLNLSGKAYEENVNECVSKGYSQEACEYEFSK